MNKLLNSFLLFGILITPPSFSEVIKVYLNDVHLVQFPRQKVISIELTAQNQSLESIFDHAYQLCIMHGIVPKSIMWEITPHNSAKFLRAFQLSNELLSAL
jgi:hypothetical protein